MIILDTNVISEALRREPNPIVLAWLDRQMADTLYLTAISLAELLYGVAVLPAGKRKKVLDAALSTLVGDLFASRILPFDEDAAARYASIASRARSRGLAIGFADGQIASIAAAHRFMVASRDVSPFMAAGVDVVDPWMSHSGGRLKLHDR